MIYKNDEFTSKMMNKNFIKTLSFEKNLRNKKIVKYLKMLVLDFIEG